MSRILWLIALIAASPSMAYAQDPGGEVVGQLGKIIRWTGVFPSILLIVGTYFVLRFIASTVDRLGNQFANQRMLFQKIATFMQFIIYIAVTISVIALSVQLDDKVITLIGGTFALAVGFAIRDLVASFIAGIMVMIDRPFQVGDRVSFGGQYGDITAIGLRSVRMQTLDDNTITIPNNKFLTDIVSSGNYGALDMQVVMDFYVGMDQDIPRAREIVSEAALSSRYVHLPKPVVVLVNQIMQENLIAVRFRLKAYVMDTRYEKAFETDVNLRVMQAFREAGIQPPAILHRTLDYKPSLTE
jgi:small-conductance mechanosensitive channel